MLRDVSRARSSACSPTTTLEGDVPVPGFASASAWAQTPRTATTSTTTRADTFAPCAAARYAARAVSGGVFLIHCLCGTEDGSRFTDAWGRRCVTVRANANASFQADLQKQIALRAGLGREVPPGWGMHAREGDPSGSDPVPVDADGCEQYEFQLDNAGMAGTRAGVGQVQEDGGAQKDVQVPGGATSLHGRRPSRHRSRARRPRSAFTSAAAASSIPSAAPSPPDDAATTFPHMRSLSRHLAALDARAAALDVTAQNVRRHIEVFGVPMPGVGGRAASSPSSTGMSTDVGTVGSG
ncbi:hypothetical protein B0H19DRAFT_1373445 [Mycena capillaripes]|nr:hypothetical protein B0H19DRAFT_1373445 [Mycena capillaripes]